MKNLSAHSMFVFFILAGSAHAQCIINEARIINEPLLPIMNPGVPVAQPLVIPPLVVPSLTIPPLVIPPISAPALQQLEENRRLEEANGGGGELREFEGVREDGVERRRGHEEHREFVERVERERCGAPNIRRHTMVLAWNPIGRRAH